MQGGRARDHAEARDLSQAARDLLSDSVREVLILCGAEVLERKNEDLRPPVFTHARMGEPAAHERDATDHERDTHHPDRWDKAAQRRPHGLRLARRSGAFKRGQDTRQIGSAREAVRRKLRHSADHHLIQSVGHGLAPSRSVRSRLGKALRDYRLR